MGITNVGERRAGIPRICRILPTVHLPPGPPIVIQDDDEEHEEWEVLNIVDCRKTKRYGIQYKATYIGNWEEWNASPAWQPWTDFVNAKNKISEFHRRHHEKPKAPPELTDNDGNLVENRVH